MPTPTYVAISKTVLTASAADITFSAIPSTYTDLVLLVSARSGTSNTYDFMRITLNADNSALYSTTLLWGFGTSTGSSRSSSQVILQTNFAISGNTATSNTFGSSEFYFPNYAGSANKVISSTSLSETNAAGSTEIDNVAGLYRSTSAISSIKLDLSGNNFLTGSRFDLYGIKNS